MIKGKEQCLIPEYILRFLEKLYLGIVPEDYGQRMVSRKLLSKMKALYHFYNDKIPSNFGRLLCPEYLIEFIEKLHIIEYTDEDEGYIKEVPAGALKFAFINAWGGMSYKSENLFIKENCTLDKVLNSSTGQISDDSNSFVSDFIPVLSGSTYNYNLGVNFGTAFYDSNKDFVSGSSYSTTFTIPSGVSYIRMSAYKTRIPTLMITKGSTIPTEYKEGFEGIRDSATTSFTSKDSSDVIIETLSVPAEVQALPGYGWGVNYSVFNYIYYDTYAKKWYSVQNVGSKKLKDISLLYDGQRFRGILMDCKAEVGVRNDNLLIVGYEATSTPGVATLGTAFLSMQMNDDKKYIFLYSDATSTSELIQNEGEKTLYYQLDSPIIKDITSLMPSNFGYIEVRPEGKVIFNNEYEQAVPSMITYLVEVE